MILKSRVTFANEKIKKEFEQLKEGDFSEKELYKFLNQALQNIAENIYCGTRIKNKLIPKEYIQKYKVNNLWKYDLPKGWRLIYTLNRNEIEIVSIILEYFDHKQYEDRFNYCFAVA